jgi:hypothetical protein
MSRLERHDRWKYPALICMGQGSGDSRRSEGWREASRVPSIRHDPLFAVAPNRLIALIHRRQKRFRPPSVRGGVDVQIAR